MIRRSLTLLATHCLTALLLLAAALSAALPAAEADYAPAISGEVLHANTLEFGVLSFRDVVARPELHGRKMLFDRCQAKAYGGMVTGWLSIDLPKPDPKGGPASAIVYNAHFDLVKADLATLLRQLGGNAENLSGTLNGWIDFSLPADRPDQLSGHGELSITDGSFVQLPVLANLLVGDPGASKGKDRLETRFNLGDGKLSLVFAQIDSPSAKISIFGHIGYDGDLRLSLEPLFANKIADAITGGVATFILNPLTRRAARFAVRGQITNPVLVSDPFGKGAQ